VSYVFIVLHLSSPSRSSSVLALQVLRVSLLFSSTSKGSPVRFCAYLRCLRKNFLADPHALPHESHWSKADFGLCFAHSTSVFLSLSLSLSLAFILIDSSEISD
jgi:hypothetical protein